MHAKILKSRGFMDIKFGTSSQIFHRTFSTKTSSPKICTQIFYQTVSTETNFPPVYWIYICMSFAQLTWSSLLVVFFFALLEACDFVFCYLWQMENKMCKCTEQTHICPIALRTSSNQANNVKFVSCKIFKAL